MKYYKCKSKWFDSYDYNHIYPENHQIKGNSIITTLITFSNDFDVVDEIDYLIQEYNANNLSGNDVFDLHRRGDITLLEYHKIINNKRENSMKVELEKDKLLLAYRNGNYTVKRTLEDMYGKELLKCSYTIGNKFKYCVDDEVHVLAQVNPKMVTLINIEKGNRYYDAIKVDNPTNVSSEEMDRLCEGAFCHWTKI